jgi:hypothetical protein
VQQGEQEVLHARDSVGQMSIAAQRCLNPGFSERIGISRRTGESALSEEWDLVPVRFTRMVASLKGTSVP